MLETELLAGLIAKKFETLTTLRDLSNRQAELVESGDMVQLMKVLSAKQQLIGAIRSVEQDLDRFRDQDPESRIWSSPTERERCAQQSAECQTLLNQILEGEKASESRLVHRRDQAAAQLQGAHTAQHARHAYNTTPPTQSGMLDLTSDR